MTSIPLPPPTHPALIALRDVALAYPEAWEDSPWGERAIKVRKKVFLFCGVPDGCLKITVKLPHSAPFALLEPWATPTGYGLGKSGWVSCAFPEGAAVPVDLLQAWIDESYRAVAPKTLVKRLPPVE